MNDQDVFEVFKLSSVLKEVPNESILSTKWVFTKKQNPERFKGRNWLIHTFRVKVAFLHRLIDKPIYLWTPKGIYFPKHSVLKLKKELYGTKKAVRCWWLHLKEILHINGEDPSSYYFDSPKGKAILWIHVDDGALTGSLNEVLDYILGYRSLQIKWDTKVTRLVGLLIAKIAKGYRFYQTDLIDKLINLTPSKITSSSPLPPHCKLESNASNILDKKYLKGIGILLYIAQGSRPDISYAANYLARFSMGTNASHWEALEHLIVYIRKTRLMGAQITRSEHFHTLHTYVDTNGGDEGHQSTHGFLLMHSNNPILWQSKRQATVAASTAQAKYISLSFFAQECLWILNSYHPLLCNTAPTFFSDNKTAIGIANGSVSRMKTRHFIQ
ncbi:hypothetical protein O181_087956 [Austropuccinia psidii MF-1]|uniref:Reverse transcriptase Ty1/copia-type domain-containing protein n=1 Tax=Austropuccinia psidii MF-1 TaxID=1389203 RepID=A0A9Q3P6D0_9BASI|nr:hypothetical protein [Austropuccinia psidii MF-1]